MAVDTEVGVGKMDKMSFATRVGIRAGVIQEGRMSHPIIQQVEQEEAGKQQLPEFNVGDTVDVYVKIVEGEQERVQISTAP